MKHLLSALAAAALLALPAVAFADDDLGSDDPSLQQKVSAEEELAQAGEQVTIDRGHVDLGPRIIDGEWTFLARDDTAKLSGGKAVWRQPEDVVFKVNDAAQLDAPSGEDYAFIGASPGERVWAVPQNEVSGVVWLGWNTQAPEVVASIERGVTLEFQRVEHLDGDGAMSVFLQPGNFAPPQVLFDGATPSQAWVDLNTHTHANWVFTQPGGYLVTLGIVGEDGAGKEFHDDMTLRFQVGDAAAPSPTESKKTTEAMTDAPAPVASTEAEPSPSPKAKEGASRNPSESPSVSPTASTGSSSKPSESPSVSPSESVSPEASPSPEAATSPKTSPSAGTASTMPSTASAVDAQPDSGASLVYWLAGGTGAAVLAGCAFWFSSRRQRAMEAEVFDELS